MRYRELLRETVNRLGWFYDAKRGERIHLPEDEDHYETAEARGQTLQQMIDQGMVRVRYHDMDGNFLAVMADSKQSAQKALRDALTTVHPSKASIEFPGRFFELDPAEMLLFVEKGRLPHL